MSKKILIVEDEIFLSKTLRKRLSSAGYEVDVAIDAYQGVEHAHKWKPDLIILDLMLPCGGGIAVLESLQSSTELSFLPVIVLTGMNDDEYKRKVLEMGVDAYIEKPYDATNLLNTIKQLVS